MTLGKGDVRAAVQGVPDMISIPRDNKQTIVNYDYKSEKSIKQAPSTWHMTSYEMSLKTYKSFAALAMHCEEE